jgi:hypothetical protein
MKRHGIYVGTLKIDRPWYSRRMRHIGFPENGPGEFWYDYKGFYFVGSDTNRGLVIPSDSIISVSLDFHHGWTFSWTKILRIVWRRGQERVSSGFIVPQPGQVMEALTTTGWA